MIAMTHRHHQQVSSMLLLLVLVLQVLTTTLCYSIEDNRIDFNDVAAVGSAPSVNKPSNISISRRMFALCPPHFHRVGGACYLVPEQRNSWLEAHFFCRSKNAKLAEPIANEDRKLNRFLKRHFPVSQERDSFWIGAAYDWQRHVWQWSINGKDLTYNSFDLATNLEDLENHCAVYDPATNYRWSANLCSEKQRFICQHKMPRVSGRNRHKIYERWNATYPNEYANEFMLKVINRRSNNGNSPHRRSKYENWQRYPQETSTKLTTTTTEHSQSENEVLRPTYADRRTPQRSKETYYDRKLQKQREKERRRLHNRKMREHENQRRKALRAQLEKQRAQEQHERESVPENLYYRPTTTITTTKTTTKMPEMSTTTIGNNPEYEQKEQETFEKHNRKDDEDLRQRLRYQKERDEEFKKQRDAQASKEANDLAEQEKRAKEIREEHSRQLQKEYEQTVEQAQLEQEERRKMELERKRQQDIENRRLEEEKAAEMAERAKLALQEEELRLEQQRAEEAKRLEEMERERLYMEEQHRLQAEAKRQKEIAQLEEEKRRIEEEEKRILQEQAEELRLREQALHAISSTSTEKPIVNNSVTEAPVSESIFAERDQIKQKLDQKRQNYAERISRLPKEAQRKFLEFRKQRKALKLLEKKQQETQNT